MALTKIGITGEGGSGKDVGARIAREYGIVDLSTGNVIRRHLDTLGLPHERERLQIAGNYLRMIHGGDYMCIQSLEDARDDIDLAAGRVLYTGVRTMDEVDFILSAHGFLIYVTAEQDARMRWRMEDARPGDENLTEARFRYQDDYELGEGEQRAGYTIHLAEVRRHASVVIANDGTLSELEDKFRLLFGSL